jgi:hypothetical protein
MTLRRICTTIRRYLFSVILVLRGKYRTLRENLSLIITIGNGCILLILYC